MLVLLTARIYFCTFFVARIFIKFLNIGLWSALLLLSYAVNYATVDGKSPDFVRSVVSEVFLFFHCF